MRLVSWCARYLGLHVTAPGGDGGQCVDLANLYMRDVLGLPFVRRNAIDWAASPIEGLGFMPNTLVNMPPSGALVVFHAYEAQGIGSFGHISIAIASDVLHFVSLDQNWPDGSPVSLVMHDYKAVLGWLI